MAEHCDQTSPDMESLLEAGYKKQKLRAHSDFFWNRAVSEWAWQFTEYADVMCEAKAKNLASIGWYNAMSGQSIPLG